MNRYTPCPDWRERLSAYHDEQLSPKARIQVEAHLTGCADCRAALEQLTRDRDRFTAAYLDAAADVEVRDAVLKELKIMDTNTSNVKSNKLHWALGLTGVVALIGLVLLAAVLLDRQRESRQTICLNTVRQLPTAIQMNSPDHDAKLPDGGTASASNGNLSATYRPNIQFFKKDYPATSTQRHKVFKVRSGGADDFQVSNGLAGNLNTPMDDTGVPDNGKDSNYSAQFYGALVSETGRNYGVPGGIRMSYDVNYGLLVKDALQQARQAQEIIHQHQGFTTDFQYVHNENELAWASFNGKVPADQADAALQAIEKLGEVRAVTVAGEDLTEQFTRQMDEMEKMKAHAEKLEKITNRSRPRDAMHAESQRHQAEEQAAAAHRALLGLTAKNKLVTLSVSFTEGKVREPITLASAGDAISGILHFLLLLLVTVAVLTLLVAVLVVPWVVLRRLRTKAIG